MTKSSSIWGGRFETAVDSTMEQINASIDVDKRLYKQDIAASKAHARMLMETGILNTADEAAMQGGLDRILQEIESGDFVFRRELEDIHMNIETRLRELIGDTAGRLHTARSRNDQVATDFRLWVREACDIVAEEIAALQGIIKVLVQEHKATIMPGFTHLQVAQPVTLALHLDAYHHMLERDLGRVHDCRRRLNLSPLGAAALAGTSYPIDRVMTASLLGFDGVEANTIDAVGSRDFATEFLFTLAQCGLHLSRLAEEIILWSTSQFGFMRLADAWSTGSSIMPQKKNADAAELVRGKAAHLTSNLLQLMMILKGLPLAYNKDLQDDKPPVFASFDTILLALRATGGMLATASWNTAVMREAAESGYATATELADWLVRTLRLPFRDAHHVTGKIVKLAEKKGVQLTELSLIEMQEIEPQITQDVFACLSSEAALKSRGLI